MKKIGWLALSFSVVACSHKQPGMPQSGSAPVNEEAAVTGIAPVYPRALPVALPAAAAPANQTHSVIIAAAPVVPMTNAVPSAPSPVETPAPTAVTTAPDGVMPPPVLTATPVTNSVPTETSTAVSVGSTPPSASTSATEASDQVVVLQTSFGRIVLQLDDFAAPKTCANFRKLVANGFYNGTIFHRVIPNFMIQGGDPNTKTEDRSIYGQGGPGYTVPPEIALHHDRGGVAMARLPDGANPQRNSNGSQFYICVAPCPSLDDKYTVFAHVISGMDVAIKIANASRDKRDDPLERIAMDARLEPRDQALQETAGSTTNR